MANDIVKPGKITIGGGLHGRIKAAEVLKEITKTDPLTMPNRLAVICDFSGSMDGRSSDGNMKTKLQLLTDAVQDFSLRSNTQDTAIAVESFPSGFRIDLTNDSQQIYMRMIGVRTLGSTPMGEGIENSLKLHSPTRCMLISDGEQTDGDAPFHAAREAKKKEIIIDTVHIGSSAGGEETLKTIAEITGGMYMKFTNVESFSQNFHFLLPEARAQLAGMLPYERANLLGADESR